MRYITAIHLSGGKGHEHIEEVRWHDPGLNQKGTSSRSDMVAWIKGGGDARVQDGQRDVKVEVVPVSPPYLRTKADGSYTDNLLYLPKY